MAWKPWESNTFWKYLLQRNKKLKRFAVKLCRSEILTSLEYINYNLSYYDDRDINLLPTVDDDRLNIIYRMKKRSFQNKYKYFIDTYGHILPKDCWNIIINQYDDIDPHLLPSEFDPFYPSKHAFSFIQIYGNISNIIQLILLILCLLGYNGLIISLLLFITSFLHIIIGYLIYEIHFSQRYISMLHRFKSAIGNKFDYRDIELFQPFQQFCGIPLFWNVCIYKKTYSLYRKYKIICNKSSHILLLKYMNICIYSIYSMIINESISIYKPHRIISECMFVTYIGCFISMYIICHNSIYQNNELIKLESLLFVFFVTGLYIGCLWCFSFLFIFNNIYFEYLKHLPIIIWGMKWAFQYRFKMILFMLSIVWYSYLMTLCTISQGYLYQIMFMKTEWSFTLFRLFIAILMFGDLYWTFIWNQSKHMILFYFLPFYRRLICN